MTLKLALRSLGRSRRRTLLSVLGVGIGCAIAVFSTAFMRGGRELRVRAISESGFGHLRLAPSGWEQSRDSDLRLPGWSRLLADVRALDGIATATPHARAQGLLAFGTRVSGVELLGVDPLAEGRVNRLMRALSEGRYLLPGDTRSVVVGSALVERLDVELGDDLLLTLSRADGELEYSMLRIVGIVETGSREIDSSICHVTLKQLEQLTGLEGAAEITVVVGDPLRLDRMARQLARQVPTGTDVLTWRQVLPAMGGDAAADQAFTNLFIGIVIIVVILGVTSAQLTAVLERQREFAVLNALGMKDSHVVWLVLLEAAAMGAVGTLVGLALATPLVYHTATEGIDFSELMSGDVAVTGVFFDPIIYADMGLWMLPYAGFVGMASALCAALYPAWLVMRQNPAAALSVSNG